ARHCALSPDAAPIRRTNRRADLSDPRHDAGTDIAHEAAEYFGRPAGAREGDGELSTPPLARIAVGVVVERRAATSPWVEHVWRPVGVLAGVPEAAPWTPLPGTDTFYAGAADVELYRSETTNYRYNLTSEQPSVWVVLRPTDGDPPFTVVRVTADPAEGE